MGRPPLQDGDKRTDMIRVRVTTDELAEIAAAAAHDGAQVSTWMRMIALRAARAAE